MNELQRFDEIIEKINDCVEFYRRSNMSSNRTTLCLANGDFINVKIPENNIAHLLGVNIDYLRISGRFNRTMNTYDCLNYFLDESYTFKKFIQTKQLSLENMFSKDIDKKLECFKENIRIKIDDLVVVKYDREKSYQSDEIGENSDYFLVRRSEGTYYVLGIIKDERSKDVGRPQVFLPVTSRKYDNYDDFSNFMKKISYNQELTYANSIIIVNRNQDFHNQYHLNLDVKIKLIDMIMSLAKENKAVPSFGKDFLFIINKYKNLHQENSKYKEFLVLLSNCLKEQIYLESDSATRLEETILKNEFIELMEVINDSILQKIDSKSDSNAQESYSSLVKEREKLMQELKEQKEELLQLREQQQKLQEENLELQQQKTLYQEQVSIFTEAYEKANALALIKKQIDNSY